MEILYLRDRDKKYFERFENALKDVSNFSDVWNSIMIRNVLDISENYDKNVYADYPLLAHIIEERVKAYLDVENCRHLPENFPTKRLHLKRFDIAAKNALIDIVNNDESYKLFNTTDMLNYVVLDNATMELDNFAIWHGNNVIGNIVVNTIELADAWTIAYYIIPSCRNRGYAKEALMEIIDRIHNHKIFDLERTELDDVYDRKYCKCLKANVACDNVASVKLLESVGFSIEEEKNGRRIYKMNIQCWLLAGNFTGREFSSYPFFVPLRNFNTF